MSYEVLITVGAERDIESITDYIARTDSPQAAERVLDGILDAANRLAALPLRGARLPELDALGIDEYRQVHFKPYRIIYRVVDKQVVIFIIADGRREMESLLERRLLGG
jgi:toxin ParE1/3/4